MEDLAEERQRPIHAVALRADRTTQWRWRGSTDGEPGPRTRPAELERLRIRLHARLYDSA